jgi:hypothetical protein
VTRPTRRDNYAVADDLACDRDRGTAPSTPPEGDHVRAVDVLLKNAVAWDAGDETLTVVGW